MLDKNTKEKYLYCSEDNLWNDFKRGDEQAYEFMFKKYYNLLLSYGLRIHRNVEEIKDSIQQLFTGLWESRQRLGPNSSIRSYLTASLRRMILRRLNSNLHYVNIEDVSLDFHVDVSAELKYIKNQAESEQINVIKELIQTLPDRQKEALYLKYYNDYSFSEIAPQDIAAGSHGKHAGKPKKKSLLLVDPVAEVRRRGFYLTFDCKVDLISSSI